MGPTGGSRWLTIALAASLSASCAAPSRQLTSRAVEDPIVLPRRMASVSIRPAIARYEPDVGTVTTLTPSFGLGLTDRLEWHILSFGFAFLDDAPGSPLPHAPLSLAVRAGLSGIGYSTAEGWILFPLLSVEARKHVSNRWALSLSAGWSAGWVQNPLPITREYNDGLYPQGSHISDLSFAGSALRQITDRIAAGASFGLSQWNACIHPLCEWTARDGSASLRLVFRPAHWLTLDLLPSVGGRYRPAVIAIPVDPTGQAAIPPRSVHWFAVSGSVAFFW